MRTLQQSDSRFPKICLHNESTSSTVECVPVAHDVLPSSSVIVTSMVPRHLENQIMSSLETRPRRLCVVLLHISSLNLIQHHCVDSVQTSFENFKALANIFGSLEQQFVTTIIGDVLALGLR